MLENSPQNTAETLRHYPLGQGWYRVPPDPSLSQEQDSGRLFRQMSVEEVFVHVVIICHLQHQWQLLLVNVPHVIGSTFKS